MASQIQDLNYPPADFSNFESNKIVNTGVKAIDFITGLPRKISDFADDFNDTLIDTAERLQSQGGDVARQNLTENRINTIWRRAGQWLQKPNNALIVIGVIVGVIFLMRK